MTREEAVLTLQEAVDEAFGAGIEIITRDGCEAIETAIEALQERKTGKWVIDKRLHFWSCTCCEWYNDYSKKEFKYCPNCGAKMEVDELQGKMRCVLWKNYETRLGGSMNMMQ